jgi:hypothetical protein
MRRKEFFLTTFATFPAMAFSRFHSIEKIRINLLSFNLAAAGLVIH